MMVIEQFNDSKNGVFGFIKNLHANKKSVFFKYIEDAIFAIPKAGMLEKIVTSGQNGLFRTPWYIIRMMVDLMKPVSSDTIRGLS